MSHNVESKAENYEKLFIVKFHQNLWNYSILEMLRFFLCSVNSKTALNSSSEFLEFLGLNFNTSCLYALHFLKSATKRLKVSLI